MDNLDINNLNKSIEELKDLFQRRLLDDKVKVNLINKLIAEREIDSYKPLMREFILLLDRIDNYLNSEEPSIEFVSSVRQEIYEVLKHYGLSELAEIEEYNPELHKVVDICENDNLNNNCIAEHLRKGYLLENKVLRPEEVILNKK